MHVLYSSFPTANFCLGKKPLLDHPSKPIINTSIKFNGVGLVLKSLKLSQHDNLIEKRAYIILILKGVREEEIISHIYIK